MKLTEYIYYIYSYINIYRNNNIIRPIWKKFGFFFDNILLSKINIIYVYKAL